MLEDRVAHTVYVGSSGRKTRQMEAEIFSWGPPVRGTILRPPLNEIPALWPFSDDGAWLSFQTPGAWSWRYGLRLLGKNGRFVATPSDEPEAWRDMDPLGSSPA